jgi:DNA-binding GntR family transcriptional regulator
MNIVCDAPGDAEQKRGVSESFDRSSRSDPAERRVMSITDIVIPFPIQSSRRSRSQIVRQIVPEELANCMREMIAAGELRPGGHVTMQGLCDRFGVSRASVREALKLLAAEARVRPMPNWGAVDGPIAQAKIDKIVPIVGALEGLAGQLACAQITHEELADIEAMHQRLTEHFRRGDERAYAETADAICNAVFVIAANDGLSKLHQMLLRQLRWWHVADRAPPEWDEAVEEQELMLRALRVRNGDLWTLLASRHNRHRAALLRQTPGHLAKVRAFIRAAPANHRRMSPDVTSGGSLTGSSRERPMARATASKPAGFIGWPMRWLRQVDDFRSR